jgi:hypothetical protein
MRAALREACARTGYASEFDASQREYVVADTTPEAESMSFRIQMERRQQIYQQHDPPTREELDIALVEMERMYKGVSADVTDWSTRGNFEAAIGDLDLTSSPGLPYLKEAPTIGQWMGFDLVKGYDPMQVERLWLDVQTVIAGDFDHIFRVFVKDEPHTAKKAADGRWRLIIASSLAVQVVWRMCFRIQNQLLNSMASQIPSKHGIVFCYGGWRDFLADLERKGICYYRDITGWDVNSPGWVFQAIEQLRGRLARGVSHTWKDMVHSLYEDAYASSKMQLSNGTVYEQQFRGFMKSGLYNTITDNSLAMLFMHLVASRRSGLNPGHLYATGDDTLQSTMSDQYISSLERLGCKVKMVEKGKEFMGLSFDEGEPKPIYLRKNMYSIITKPREVVEQCLDAYLRLYAHSPAYVVWEKMAEGLGINIHSREFYLFWYDSPASKFLKWS